MMPIMIVSGVSGAQEKGGRPPQPELAQTTEYYHHVRVRPKEAFEELRTTQGAADQATAVIGAGTDVREGRLGAETWAVESVLVPLDITEDGTEAEMLTQRLVDELES